MSNTQDKRVAVFTTDRYLYQKIKLELFGIADTVFCPTERGEVYDLVLIDRDSCDCELDGTKMTRGKAASGELKLPFAFGTISAMLTETKRVLKLLPEENCALLGGKKIKLTDVEYKLLSVLTEKAGGYTDRDELLRRVWNNDADGGVINVYVHYLREKLETDGEKIILSSRKYGYSISEKYVGGKSL
jgi:hypothetical protein